MLLSISLPAPPDLSGASRSTNPFPLRVGFSTTNICQILISSPTPFLQISSDPNIEPRGCGVSWLNACNGGFDQEISKTPLRHARKRHLVSNLFALGARVVVASRLTIVSPCGARREGAPRKLLGALVDGEPLSLASSSRASAALRSLFE